MSPLPAGSTIGIVGGGQLGRMLAMAAARLSYKTIILEPQVNCPALQVAERQIEAAYDDEAGLDELAAACDVITYEFENVPLLAGERLANRSALYPPARALEAAQDRLTEKQFLNEIGIETADFAAVDGDDALGLALERFDGNGILKTRRLGYDGKGQRLFRDASAGAAVGVYADMGGVPLILEALVPFEREISVIAARGLNGSVIAFDPAENVHREGILRTSTVPARVSSDVVERAKGLGGSILEALDYVGVIGVEFFALADGTLKVNEIAPRVHNSGHWTEAACVMSQFELHIRAITGHALGSTARHSDCVMENLIGNDIAKVPALLAQPDTLVHLYGKSESRPGRKMGHVTRLVRG